MKVFVATSFSTQVDDRGRVFDAHRQEVSKLLGSLRSAGHEVFCAVEAHNWAMGSQTADDAVAEEGSAR